MELTVHIKMEGRISTDNPLLFIEYTYCGKRVISTTYIVTKDFCLPNHIMCYDCVDEWENEDIRMKTPQKTEKLMDLNEKD